MTALQADVAALRELVDLAKHHKAKTDAEVYIYADSLHDAAPAIERLLGIVSAVEKLEAEWRDGLPGMSDGEREIYTAFRKGCADELKALLDREK